MESLWLDQIVAELKGRRGTFRKIAAATGIGYSTLHKIAQGRIKNPGIRQCERIATVLMLDLQK